MVRSAHILILCAAGLLALGVLMVHSAGSTVGGPEGTTLDTTYNGAGPWSQFLSKNTLYAGIALLALLIGSRVNLHELFTAKALSNPLLYIIPLAIGLQAVLLIPGVGETVNGATRWLKLGPITFQPSELVKWTTILAIAWWCARRRGVMHKFFAGVLPPAILIGGVCCLIVDQDLGTGVLIAGATGVMLLAGGMRFWVLVPGLVVGGAGVYYAITQERYRMERLMIYRDPWVDPMGAGYHPIQSQLAFAQGGVPGSGLGHSIQKYYIPEDTTDFIFPVLTEELGIAGAALVIALFITILWVGLGVVKESKDSFSRLVGLGVLVMLGTQAAINIAVVTVVVPTKGIALPLVSAGGTGWIMCAFAVGLVAAIDNANALQREQLTAGDAENAATDQDNNPPLRLTG
ncbi:MAG: putative peptidoglycan glycosyltransferase FtsW [Planctomycetota bacterium]